MAKAENPDRTNLRLYDVDWEILEVMSDCRRYTQQHLYDDVPELEEHSSDWIRQRISRLHDMGLVQKVGTSAMYEISNDGIAAYQIWLERGDDIEYSGQFAREVYKRGDGIDRKEWSQNGPFKDSQ